MNETFPPIPAGSPEEPKPMAIRSIGVNNVMPAMAEEARRRGARSMVAV